MDSDKPPRVENTKYFAATWNGPFLLYHSDHSYKGFGKDYSLKHANGFIITVEHTFDGKPMQTWSGLRRPARLWPGKQAAAGKGFVRLHQE